MRAPYLIAAAALSALAACGGAPAPAAPQTPRPAQAPEAPAPAAAQPAPEAAPAADGSAGDGEPAVALADPPFTAEQIRDATKVDRTYRFLLHQGGQKIDVTMRFTQVTPDFATIERTVVDAEGKVLEQASEDSTWQQLVGHAAYPAAATQISDTTVEVPAGSFDAVLYTVTGEQQGTPVVSRVYFAKALPGAPVKTEIEAGGQVVFTMELVEHLTGE